MRSQYFRRTLLATAVLVSLLVPGTLVGSQPAKAAEEVQPSPVGCADMTVPEENHASIRLRVDEPASEVQVAVDEHGKIAIGGILHKQAAMVDVSDEKVTSSDFTLGPPPEDVAAWAASWSTTLRPPHLGANEVCARAEREPKRSARILRSFTVVDLIPPSDVPDMAIGTIGATSATVTWGAATDNYGLAGYEVSVDGGAAQRTTVGTRSYKITGLAPSTSHTVSVVAIDLAGNTSTTPATASFTTDAAPPPPDGGLAFDAEQGAATATWHPDLPADVTYRVFLDGEEYVEFPLAENCLDDTGSLAKPCTPQDAITYLIEPLEESTQYEFRVDALRADGTVARSLSGSFTTTKGEDVVSPATTQLTASESSRCAGMGGDFYVAPAARTSVSAPAGSTQVFEGCYTVADSSCIDAFLPPSGEQILDCVDNLTDLLLAVAPPGRGPVISSLNDVVAGAPVPGQKIQIEPLTWCSEGACALLLAPPAQAVRLVAAAPAAVATTSVVVVTAVGIGIVTGVALGVLLAILFPGELGIYGLLEYPIDNSTNFDIFDNWAADEGEWYNSLKVYAEVIKTTNQLAGKHNIPFAWTATDEGPLKRAIDGACSAQQGKLPAVAGCDDDFAVYVPGAANYKFNPMPKTGNHIVTAMGGNNSGWPQPTQRAQWFAPAYSKKGKAAKAAGYSRNWFDQKRKHPQWQPNACTNRITVVTVCDEFPFWSTNQAVDLTGIRASLEPVPKPEGKYQGNDLAQFYSQCDVDDTDPFIVLPVKPWVDAGGPSFGFRVTSGAASLCLVPSK